MIETFKDLPRHQDKPQNEPIASPVYLPQELEKAVADFDKGELSTQAQLHLDSTANLIREGQTEKALHVLREILNLDPYCVIAIQRLGKCLRVQGKYAEAVKCYRQLCKLAPDHQAYFLLADCYYLLNEDQKALQAYLACMRFAHNESPYLFEIYKNLGNIYVRAGDFESGEENYNKAYTLRPDSDVLLVNYGTLEIQRDNLDAAIARYRTAIELNSTNDKAWVGLALVHRHFGDLQLAWANLEQALDIHFANVTALQLAADWAVTDGKIQRAIEHIQRYLDYNGNDPQMALVLAKLFGILGRLPDAEIELSRALALDPQIAGGIEFLQQLRAAQAGQLR